MNILFSIAVVSGLVLLYTYAGYYLGLGLLALVKRPRLGNTDLPTGTGVSVVLCVHNSVDRIAARLRNLLAQKDVPADYEILVASDGSTDATAERARQIGREESPGSIHVFEFAQQRGKAGVINEVLPLCRGRIVVFCDVRQEFELDAVSRLIASVSRDRIGAVSGGLVLRKGGASSTAGAGIARYWDHEKKLRELESRVGSVCGCTGAIYAIRRDLFVPIHPDTVLDDVAIPMLIAMKGHRILFDREAVAYDSEPGELGEEKRRKIRTLAGNLQLCMLYPSFINPFRNRLFLQFVFHKLLRLMSPWLLLVLLVSSVMLGASSVQWLAFAALQGGWYAAGAAGLLLSRWNISAKLFAIPAGFLGLNIFAALAWLHFLRGRTKAAWGQKLEAG